MNTQPDQLQQAVFESVAETFEAMIFTQVAMPPPEESIVPGIDLVQASIAVIQPVTGRLSILVPPSMAVHITKNLYGWTDVQDPGDDLVNDSISELINTIAGRVMTRILPEDQTFELGLPVLGDDGNLSNQVVRYQFKADMDDFFFYVEGDIV